MSLKCEEEMLTSQEMGVLEPQWWGRVGKHWLRSGDGWGTERAQKSLSRGDS